MRIILKDKKDSDKTLMELYHAGNIEMYDVLSLDFIQITQQEERVVLSVNGEVVWRQPDIE